MGRSWSEIAEIVEKEHNIDISADTIMRRCHEVGIRWYIPYVKSLLNDDKRLREDFNLLKKSKQYPMQTTPVYWKDSSLRMKQSSDYLKINLVVMTT